MKTIDKTFQGIVLGGWGFDLDSIDIAKYHQISHHRFPFGRLSYALPPIFRTIDGDIDLFPFLLYDNVFIDEGIYNLIVNERHYQETFRIISHKNAPLLVKLKEKDILKTIDFTTTIYDNRELVRLLHTQDFDDSAIQYANLQSMHIWKSFLEGTKASKVLQDEIDNRIENLSRAIRYQDAKLAGIIDEPSYLTNFTPSHQYLTESLHDVNSTLIISRLLEQPIYDWADHMPYYRVKFSRSLNEVNEYSKVIQKLFQTFVPHFKLAEVDELLEIKNDKRFNGLKSIILNTSSEDITDDMVSDALSDVAKIRKKQMRFSKLVSWLTTPLGFIPVMGSLIEKAASEIADLSYSRIVEKEFQWQCLFADLREKYSLDEAIIELDNKHGGGGNHYWYLKQLTEIREHKKQLSKTRIEEEKLQRKISTLQQSIKKTQENIIKEESNNPQYLGHVLTKRFHLPNCRYINKTEYDYLIELDSIQLALKKRYFPCKHCLQKINGFTKKK